MTICEPCNLRAQGQSDTAGRLESIRVSRLMLTILNGDRDFQHAIASEFGACPDCISRLATRLTVVTAGLLIRCAGSLEVAKLRVEAGLMEELNNLPPDETSPTECE